MLNNLSLPPPPSPFELLFFVWEGGGRRAEVEQTTYTSFLTGGIVGLRRRGGRGVEGS